MSSSSFNSLLFSLVAIISFSLAHSEFLKPPPKALLFPVRKDEITLQYYTEFQIGDLEIYKKTVIDIGGQYLWFNCDTYKSSIYRPVSCDSATCEKGSLCLGCISKPRPGCNNNTCGVFAYNPIQAFLSAQGLGMDTMHVTSTNGFAVSLSYDAPKFLFACADSSLLQGLGNGLDGVVGLTRSKTSLQAQLSATFKLPQKFALCLPSSSEKGLGDIFIGGGPYFMSPYTKDLSKTLISTPLIVNPFITVPIYSEDDKSEEYFIDVKSIKVDGKGLSIKPSLLAIDKKGYGGTKISTITPYTMLHASIYKTLIRQFIKAASLRKMKRVKSIAPFGACFQAKSGAWVPEIDIVLSGKNALWKINGANSMVEATKNVLCLAFVDGGAEPRTSIVLGGKQLENYLLEFDLVSSKLGFSSSLLLYNTSCSQSRLF